MLWQNLDDGRFYKLNEMTGEQVLCDSRGVDIKSFNAKITGRYNYDDRKRAILNAKADLTNVELPIQLRSNIKRNHIPQN